MRLDAIPSADTGVLEARFLDLAVKLGDIETERTAIAVELKSRERTVAATVRIRDLSESDKQALRRVLR